jgi:predicted RND superfamily exporter protein
MQQISMGLNALEYSLDDLPQTIKDRWHSQQQGVYKILIVPKYDLNKRDNLDEFVAQVQAIDPSVTGYPVIDTASGAAVAEAFIQAFISALLMIFLVLLLILRSFRNTVMVVGPLLLATLLTGALNVLLQNPFNFANSIAIPLLMGMGVDSGIHIMHRLHTGLNNNEQILQTSTARGVFFSSLTTLFSFTSLAFIPHAGIASMGLLLAIGITFTLICTLIVLPAFSDQEIHY